VVLPNFFDLDTNIRTRANYRIYTYAKRGVRGYAKFYQPQRTEWSTGWLYQELLWQYKFPQLPEKFQESYSEFKMKSLLETLSKMDKDIKKKVKDEKEKQVWGRKDTKLARIQEYLDNHPDADQYEVANELNCTPTYVQTIIKTRQST
jgi:hypothetical protein